MIGLVLLLHFGLLDLLALAWRTRRRERAAAHAPPDPRQIPRRLLGQALEHRLPRLAHDFLFEPLRRTLGPTVATAAVFLASGAIHDLVISRPRPRRLRPADALLRSSNSPACTLERTNTLRRTFTRHPLLGRAFTIVFVVAPLPLLFHEKFVRNVILPFLNAIGGLS